MCSAADRCGALRSDVNTYESEGSASSGSEGLTDFALSAGSMPAAHLSL